MKRTHFFIPQVNLTKLKAISNYVFIGTQKDNMQDWTKKGKNRLANDKTLWSNGKHMKKKKFRKEFSDLRKQEFKTGKRIPIRDN